MIRFSKWPYRYLQFNQKTYLNKTAWVVYAVNDFKHSAKPQFVGSTPTAASNGHKRVCKQYLKFAALFLFTGVGFERPCEIQDLIK